MFIHGVTHNLRVAKHVMGIFLVSLRYRAGIAKPSWPFPPWLERITGVKYAVFG